MIDAFNEVGLLPPNYMPIKTNIVEVVERFCTSKQRSILLRGLISYREELHNFELEGYQWIDGSFVTDKENREKDSDSGKAPNDIDVLTIYKLPDGATQETIADRMVFDKKYVMRKYKIDAFPIEMQTLLSENGILKLAHWVNLFSHTKVNERKNFLHIPLGSVDDSNALELINSKYPLQ